MLRKSLDIAKVDIFKGHLKGNWAKFYKIFYYVIMLVLSAYVAYIQQEEDRH